MSLETGTDVLRYSAFTPQGSGDDGGNPAGIVLDAAGLDPARMLALAAEVGYSETAFVMARDDAERRFRVRYFSPLAEVPFCGHATVATAVALAERNGLGEFVFDTPAGEIPVSTTAEPDGAVRATLTSVPTHSRPATPDERSRGGRPDRRWAPSTVGPAVHRGRRAGPCAPPASPRGPRRGC